MKLGNTDPVLACMFFCFFAISITNETASITAAMLAATFKNIQCHVNLCLQVVGNQFQHLLEPNYLHIYKDCKVSFSSVNCCAIYNY